ncbi:hypothetical protein DFH11DRAFT_1733355 [Phellopilus nigrolimitatus]|nr:hypothetical protein DFH11DRAFT_1733355 [Phellopilus nigrolimitatus]
MPRFRNTSPTETGTPRHGMGSRPRSLSTSGQARERECDGAYLHTPSSIRLASSSAPGKSKAKSKVRKPAPAPLVLDGSSSSRGGATAVQNDPPSTSTIILPSVPTININCLSTPELRDSEPEPTAPAPAPTVAPSTSTASLLPSPPQSPFSFPAFKFPSVCDSPPGNTDKYRFPADALPRGSSSGASSSMSISTPTPKTDTFSASAPSQPFNPSPFQTPTKPSYKRSHKNRVAARAHAHPYALPSTPSSSSNSRSVLPLEYTTPRAPTRPNSTRGPYYTPRCPKGSATGIPAFNTTSEFPPSPSPVKHHRDRLMQMRAEYLHGLHKDAAAGRSSRERVKEGRRVRSAGKRQEEESEERGTFAAARYFSQKHAARSNHAACDSQSQPYGLGGAAEYETMEVDVIMKDANARCDGEMSPLYNMFAGAFASIPKLTPGSEHIPGFTYPTSTLSCTISTDSMSSGAGSYAEDSDMGDSEGESSLFAYSGRPVPSLSTSVYYAPSFAYIDTARAPSASPLEVDFSPISGPDSGDVPAAMPAQTLEYLQEVEAPMSALFSPAPSPMPITPPVPPTPSSSATPASSTTDAEALSTNGEHHFSTHTPRRARNRPCPLRITSPSSDATQMRERESDTRCLRRIVPKPHPPHSAAVSSLRSPPLVYPYPYAARDRTYGALGRREEGTLIERLALLDVNLVGMETRESI